MTIGKICPRCFGGGHLVKNGDEEPIVVKCEQCRGEGFIVSERVMKIRLANGKHALIDAEDLSLVEGYPWYENPGRHTTYAATRTGPRDARRSLVMHRLILDAPKGMVVDHINGNGLDNRKQNLQLCTNRENVTKSRIISSNSSGYRGVSLCKQTGRWSASIKHKGKRIWLGRFDTAADAALAYNEAAKKFHGKFATLNHLCPRCMDTGWEPMADLYGDYDSDEPCTCVIGRQVMHQEAMPGTYSGALF